MLIQKTGLQSTVTKDVQFMFTLNMIYLDLDTAYSHVLYLDRHNEMIRDTFASDEHGQLP